MNTSANSIIPHPEGGDPFSTSTSEWTPDRDNLTDSSAEMEWNLTLENWRYAFQRILVPMISITGMIGNSITIAVLTRRSMQSSTNFYLTALAVSDLLYLLFVLSLSLKHIQEMKERSQWLYWEYLRFAHWLSDATSSTSTLLTMAFTIERYIAVCHPMKRKIFCTQTRAKRIIVAVYIFCFASTVTTPFEWKVLPNAATRNTTLHLENSALGSNATYKKAFYWYTAIVFILVPLISLTVFNLFLIMAVKRSQEQRNQLTQRSKLTASRLIEQNTSEELTSKRETSRNINSSSKASMHRNPNGMRESNQENKITRMLIAVVLLAILCQMPTAIMLIYTSFKEFHKGTTSFYVSRILGNIFNFLTSVNAASNFILYCVMSDRFRKTFLQTFCSKGLTKRYRCSYNASETTQRSCDTSSFRLPYKNSVSRHASNNHSHEKTKQNLTIENKMSISTLNSQSMELRNSRPSFGSNNSREVINGEKLLKSEMEEETSMIGGNSSSLSPLTMTRGVSISASSGSGI